MYEELAKLIYDYVSLNKDIDKIFLEKAIDIIANRRNLLVSKAYFSNDLNDSVAAGFNPLNREILISSDIFRDNGIIVTAYEDESILKENFILLKGVFWCIVMLHELEHVYQKKVMLEKNNDIETVFLTCCDVLSYINYLRGKFNENIDKNTSNFSCAILNWKMMFSEKTFSRIYYKHWNSNPSERWAQLYSYYSILEIINLLYGMSNIDSKVLDFLAYKEMTNWNMVYLGGYYSKGKYIGSPSFKYIERLPSRKFLSNIDIYDKSFDKALEKAQEKYDLRTRLYYGLPVSKMEHASVRDDRFYDMGDNFVLKKTAIKWK